LLKRNRNYGSGRGSDGASSFHVSRQNHPTFRNPEPSRALSTIIKVFRVPAAQLCHFAVLSGIVRHFWLSLHFLVGRKAMQWRDFSLFCIAHNQCEFAELLNRTFRHHKQFNSFQNAACCQRRRFTFGLAATKTG
jgi:hypothetical protein